MGDDFSIRQLGPCVIPSPLTRNYPPGRYPFRFVGDDQQVCYAVTQTDGAPPAADPPDVAGFELAGPREHIYFDPEQVGVGIVTCGGLSPGINNVIRATVLQLHHHYGVSNIQGFQYGYEGFIERYAHAVIPLSPQWVKDIHHKGGSILYSSRGPQEVTGIVDCLEAKGINILITIGGDGTLKGAHDIAGEVERRGLKIAVVGVPKTIDNDIAFCVKTFGFETAFAKAVEAIHAAHVEANGAPYGVVIVKLMGRDSGFIAANTSLACPDVNMVLVPEVPFTLEGNHGLLATLEHRLRNAAGQGTHPHAVIAVAEGAGQDLLAATGEKDQSGNVRYGDIGIFLKEHIQQHFRERLPISLKYIEPSYIIRSLPANATDAIFCFYLADHVVHAAMAGKTDMMVGYWNGHFTHVPLALATRERKRIDPNSEFWRQVLFSTGQPADMT